jgi:hypothetical protein
MMDSCLREFINIPSVADPNPHGSAYFLGSWMRKVGSWNLEALEGHFGALEGPNLETSEINKIHIKLKVRIRIRIRVKGRIRIRIKVMIRSATLQRTYCM